MNAASQSADFGIRSCFLINWFSVKELSMECLCSKKGKTGVPRQHLVAVTRLDSNVSAVRNEIHECLISKVLRPRAWTRMCLMRGRGNTCMPNRQRTSAPRHLLDAHEPC
jgi:hypothetical protein